MQLAPIVSIRPNRTYQGFVIVTVRCPHCGQTHDHGLEVGPLGDRQTRVPHCDVMRPNYLLSDPDGVLGSTPTDGA